MTLEQENLIAEAKKRFPIGCTVRDIDGDCMKITEECVFKFRFGNLNIYNNDDLEFRVILEIEGEWAKIIKHAPYKFDPFF